MDPKQFSPENNSITLKIFMSQSQMNIKKCLWICCTDSCHCKSFFQIKMQSKSCKISSSGHDHLQLWKGKTEEKWHFLSKKVSYHYTNTSNQIKMTEDYYMIHNQVGDFPIKISKVYQSILNHLEHSDWSKEIKISRIRVRLNYW